MEFYDTVMEKSWKSHGILSQRFRGNPADNFQSNKLYSLFNSADTDTISVGSLVPHISSRGMNTFIKTNANV